jgi:hypothetical protein
LKSSRKIFDCVKDERQTRAVPLSLLERHLQPESAVLQQHQLMFAELNYLKGDTDLRGADLKGRKQRFYTVHRYSRLRKKKQRCLRKSEPCTVRRHLDREQSECGSTDVAQRGGDTGSSVRGVIVQIRAIRRSSAEKRTRASGSRRASAASTIAHFVTGAQTHPVPLGMPPVDVTVAFATVFEVKVVVPLASIDEELVLLASEELRLVLEDSTAVEVLLLARLVLEARARAYKAVLAVALSILVESALRVALRMALELVTLLLFTTAVLIGLHQSMSMIENSRKIVKISLTCKHKLLSS